MSHSGDFARWPHLGLIRPMAGDGHLGPLSYVYGYRGGVGRRRVGQETTRDDGIKIRARDGRYELQAGLALVLLLQVIRGPGASLL